MATTVDLDWKNLSFGYLKTDYNIRSYFRNGAWTTPEMTSDETVNLHMAATGLHYGQEAFEGLKAFRGVDGQVLVVQDMLGMNNGFRPRFLRRYADLHTVMTDAISHYISDVKNLDFPNEKEQY